MRAVSGCSIDWGNCFRYLRRMFLFVYKAVSCSKLIHDSWQSICRMAVFS